MLEAGPIQHLLVALDAHGMALPAVERGFELAETLQAELQIIHAAEIDQRSRRLSELNEILRDQSEQVADSRARVLERLRELDVESARFEQVESLLRIYPGHPAQVILEFADMTAADLIVLGPHSRHSLLDLGRTARAVLAHANAPIWIQSEPIEPIAEILVPIDFSSHSRRALDMARALGRRLNATVKLLHCYATPAFAYANTSQAYPSATYVIDEERAAAKRELGQWRDKFNANDGPQPGGAPATSAFAEGNPLRCILDTAQRSDLVVIGTHGRTCLSRFLMGSVANDILRHCRRPVLAIPDAQAAFAFDRSDAAMLSRAAANTSSSGADYALRRRAQEVCP